MSGLDPDSVHIYHSTHVGLVGIGSKELLSAVIELGCQTWWQVHLPAELSC